MNINNLNRILIFTIIISMLGFSNSYATSEIITEKAPEQQSTQLNYDVYAGGMHALEAELEIDKNKSDYTIRLTAKTHGFIGGLFPWKADYKTDGIIKDDKLIPKNYVSKSSWKDKLKQTELKYSNNGDLLEKIVTKKNKTSKNSNIDKNLTSDSVDMLTAAVSLLNKTAKQEDKCDGSVAAFDGKRKFNIVFKNAGIANIAKSKYSVYQGKALKCTITVEPVAGFRKKDKKKGWMAIQNHTMERKKLPTIWVANINGSDEMVLVRMEIASSYGTVIAHLTKTNIKPPLLSAK